MTNRRVPKETLEEVKTNIRLCESRISELEKSIKSTSNTGTKTLMQNTYILNNTLLKYYKTIYARLML